LCRGLFDTPEALNYPFFMEAVPKKTTMRRWITGIAAAAVIILMLYALQGLFTLLFISFIIAYILHPAVDRLERIRFINRTLAMVICLFAILTVIGIFVIVIFPQLIMEFGRFAQQLPENISRISDHLRPWLRQRLDFELPSTFDQFMKQFGGHIRELAPGALGTASDILNPVFSSIRTLFSFFGTLVLVPFFSFFFLRDYARVVETARDMIPVTRRESVVSIFMEIDQTLAGFLRGELMVMITLGVLYSTGLLIVGAPIALGVGLLTGLLCFIPYLGFAIGLIFALLINLLQVGTWTGLLSVLIVYTIVQVLDGFFITPHILGKKVGLHPALVILALIAGGELLGFVGVLAAVPAAAILNIVLKRTLEYYKHSAVYTGEE